MVKSLYQVSGAGFDPYQNLAMEEYLLSHVPKDGCVLYLWQNARTVVIGRNQCAWRECDMTALEKDGGRLARRLSGGGAVYHDLGNLNFTFLAADEDYNLTRQLKVVAGAVGAFGLVPLFTGRNDLTVDGRKFSGGAYYHAKGASYHHGTLMVEVDRAAMEKYLSVDPDKLRAKGVASVRARVVNLRELDFAITVEALKTAMLDAFSREYGLPVQPFPTIDHAAAAALIPHYSSWEWRIGRDIPCNFNISRRFSWGSARLQLDIRAGQVIHCRLWSDAMAQEAISAAQTLLTGRRAETLCQALSPLADQHAEIYRDLCALIGEELHV